MMEFRLDVLLDVNGLSHRGAVIAEVDGWRVEPGEAGWEAELQHVHEALVLKEVLGATPFGYAQTM